LDCAECFNQEARKFGPGQEHEVQEVLGWIPRSGIEGITLSGGEPFWHAEACAELAAEVKKLGLSVMVYSGFTLDRIKAVAKPGWLELLDQADILVDGPFQPWVPSQHLWAGSGNQKVHYLTGRYSLGDFDEIKDFQQCEVIIGESGDIVVTGFPGGKF
jgi:anaerobic ribonucleoside-triphosphate reductase activating protein